MKLQTRIFLAIGIILSCTFVILETLSYNRIKEESVQEMLNLAEQVHGILMSTRRIYHHQFLDNGTELTSKTLGFLPAYALSRISKDYQNFSDTGLYFNNVSDRPRNHNNSADEVEMAAINYFRQNSKEKVRFLEISNSNGELYYHYARPIWVEPYCIKCHGDKSDAPAAIQATYNTSYDYKIGDLRGIISIKIPADHINHRMVTSFIQDMTIQLIAFLLVFLFLWVILHRFVSRPLVKLNKSMNAIASGDYSTKLLGLEGDFSQISQTFNNVVVRRQHAEKQSKRLLQTQTVINILLHLANDPVTLDKQLEMALDIILSGIWINTLNQGKIFLYDDISDELVMKSQRGLSDSFIDSYASITFDKRLYNQVIKTGKIIFVDSVEIYQFCLCSEIKHHSHYCAPISSGEQLIGILTICLPEKHVQSEEEEEFLTIVANTMAEIIERKRLVEELQEAKIKADKANASKSYFLATMSHDIRTPMNAILGMGEVLAESGLNVKQNYFLKVLTNAGEMLLSLINNILDLSKIEAGELKIEAVPFDLHNLIEKITDIFVPNIQSKNLELLYKIEKTCPRMVTGDSKRLQQVLLNLIGNSIKFTKIGTITLIVEPQGEEHISFTVLDTGIGIPEDKLGKIFSPFRQAEDSTTRQFGGSGLGLSICSQLVKAMEGEILVKSTVGKGSSFHFTAHLPVSTGVTFDDQIIQLPPREYPQDDKNNSLRILYVDDVKDNRLVIAAFLKHTHHHIEMAVNGKKAVKAFKSRNFDLVLMDVMMPVLDGFGAIKKMRDWEKRQEQPPTPIVALTANAMSEDIIKTSAAGFDMHLAKPIRKAYLLEVIAQFQQQIRSSIIHGMTTAKVEPKISVAQTWNKQSEEKDLPTLDTKILNIVKMEIGSSCEIIVQNFILRLPSWMDEMQEVFDAGDIRKLHNLAHKLKGSGRQFGTMLLATHCENLENMTIDGNLSEVPKLLVEIAREIKQVTEAFQEFNWGSVDD
jgi:signal transduction histidine kinase/CheY-like chemotaxis protein/HPt (histidine-containing phosphotransfer) domain-containing protein